MNKKAIMRKRFLLGLLLVAGGALAQAQPAPQADRPGNAVQHPWQGKRIGYLGDSITDPNCMPEVKKYWAYLQEWLNATAYVYAVNGRQWDDIPRQAEQLHREHGNEVDAILVFIGTNDYNGGVPIGEWFTEKAEPTASPKGEPLRWGTRMHRTPVMDNATFKGRINRGVSRLKELFPDKQIILLTPLHRGYAKFSDDNVQPDENYQNHCGEYVDAYIQAVKEAGNVWAVPVIDLNAVSGINPMAEAQVPYFHNAESDRLHPGTQGHIRLARTLYFQLLAYPATF